MEHADESGEQLSVCARRTTFFGNQIENALDAFANLQRLQFTNFCCRSSNMLAENPEIGRC